MLLSDRDLKQAIKDGRLGITPYDEELVQPASIDVRLSPLYACLDGSGPESVKDYIDPKTSQQNRFTFHRAARQEDGHNWPISLSPGGFILASTMERVTLPDDLAARLEGKSSLGRLGLFIHTTAGFIDPGFSGYITLELSNATQFPILLYPGMKIGQLCVLPMSSPVENAYGTSPVGSHYQDQYGPTLSRSHVNFRTWSCDE